MAITATSIATLNSTTDSTSYLLSSGTTTLNRVYLLFVSSAEAANPPEPTPSKTGITFDSIGLTTINAATDRKITLFRGKATATNTSQLSLSFSSTQTCCEAVLVELGGDIDTGGTNGANALVLSNLNTLSDGIAATSCLRTLNAFASASNGVIGFFLIVANEALTAGSGFTVIAQGNHGTPATGWLCEFLATNDTSVDASWTSSVQWASIIVELSAVASGAGLVTRKALLGVGI